MAESPHVERLVEEALDGVDPRLVLDGRTREGVEEWHAARAREGDELSHRSLVLRDRLAQYFGLTDEPEPDPRRGDQGDGQGDDYGDTPPF